MKSYFKCIFLSWVVCGITSCDKELAPPTPVVQASGLPTLQIFTENSAAITSKDDYVKGTLKLDLANETESADAIDTPMKIKGRGNSTWALPKKPYKIKFETKTSLLGEPADKEWVLLANYYDKTLLRNDIAFSMGRISKLEYTPSSNFVNVYINGKYNGIYQLSDQLKISEDRVNVGKDGFLMEIDGKADAEDITFKVPHVGQPINIKDPDVEVGGEAYNYLVSFLNEADAALFAKDFTDPTSGYTKYIDVESFVDWYLINEITKNADAIFFTSCYMNLTRGGKLKMGPLWDFDLAFGNYVMDKKREINDPEGFWILKHVHWYIRLFEDPNFVQKVKERFNYFYSNREQIYSKLHEHCIYLEKSLYAENQKWQQLCRDQYTQEHVWDHYNRELHALELWLEHRFNWLKDQFSAI